VRDAGMDASQIAIPYVLWAIIAYKVVATGMIRNYHSA
jgi:hypothetical protein